MLFPNEIEFYMSIGELFGAFGVMLGKLITN